VFSQAFVVHFIWINIPTTVPALVYVEQLPEIGRGTGDDGLGLNGLIFQNIDEVKSTPGVIIRCTKIGLCELFDYLRGRLRESLSNDCVWRLDAPC
jgi:hypothetical protein